MAGTYVTVKPEIITWILNTIQFDNVASSVIEMLNKWLSGEKTPTFNQIEEVSKKTNIPFGYFFLEKPPVEECPMADYRTVKSISIPEPSRNLMDTLDLMTDIQEWMVEYVIDNGQDILDYVGSASNKRSVDYIVKSIRENLNIAEDWYLSGSTASDLFRFLKNIYTNAGIIVMMNGIVGNNTRRKLNIEEFRAFTLINQYAPLIFINTCDTENGKLFSLLHELAHIWIGTNSLYNTPLSANEIGDSDEVLCNAVAAELLVPRKMFLEKWDTEDGDTLTKIEALAKYFRCSRFVIVRKALDLNKISQKKYNEIVQMLIKQFEQWKVLQNEKKGSGGDYYRTMGSRLDYRLVEALSSSAKEGRTQYTEVYRLTNTNRKTFGKLLSNMGGAAW